MPSTIGCDGSVCHQFPLMSYCAIYRTDCRSSEPTHYVVSKDFHSEYTPSQGYVPPHMQQWLYVVNAYNELRDTLNSARKGSEYSNPASVNEGCYT